MPVSNSANFKLDLNTDLPLALFPIRLETRFADDGSLLIRIYPDSVHVDSFESKPTEIEIEWGENFWKQTLSAGNNEARKISAWAKLAEKFGANRAAWIAKQLTPLDSGKFPSLNTHVEAWNRAPHTRILPARWIASVYEDGKSEPFIFKGSDIQQPLKVGLYPKEKRANEAGLDADTFENDPELGWLVKFEEAEKKGMGLRIPRDKISSGNIKRIVLLGVNPGLKNGQGQQRLEELIDAHHYTQGISFLLQGTPTNNTDDAPSGYSTLDPGFEKSFRIERKTVSPPAESCHRAVAARALGIQDSFFEHVRDATAQEQLDAQNMNTVLWQATWGSFLEHMMAGPNAPTDEKLRKGRDHFQRYVRARGPLPALRIGKQPYGLLPVISLDKLDKSYKDSKDQSMDAQLVNFLRNLREVWQRSLVNLPQVVSDDKIGDEFKKILAMTPTSVAYTQRSAQRIALRSIPPSSNAHLSGNQTTKDLARQLGLSWMPRQVRMIYGDILQEPLWSDLLVGSNLLKNPNFEGEEGQQSIPLEGKGVGIVSAAEKWTLWNNVEGITTTKLISSSSPYGESKTMIQVTTTGTASGLVQTFLPNDAGPTKIVASAWIFVRRGHVGIGIGNGGNTHLDVISKTTGQWEYLEATNGVSPANEFIIYSVSEGGADFYVSTTYVAETPQSYCEWLITGNYNMILQRKLSATSDSLFHWLVREACFREYLGAACRIVKRTNPNQNCIEPEFENGDVPALSNLLDHPVSSSNPIKIGDYLDAIKKKLKSNEFNLEKIPEAKNLQQELNDFTAFYKSLDYLVNQPVDNLEGLLKETLDLCSHRYDAWVTSLATKRLDTLRKRQPTGINIGGYGWIENLAPIKRGLINPSSECEHDPKLPLYKSENSQGFIHAPSLAHATTAALLRSGYKSHFDTKDQNSFAVNLSSERVRIAQWLLDGVRQGQSLSALLGYRFERGLHENRLGVEIPLDGYIPFFRKISRIDAETLSSMSRNDIKALSRSEGVDGLGLLHKWQKNWNRKIPWDKYPESAPPDSHKAACENEIKQLEDAVDAIDDLVIAESVHHVSQGNPVRAGAALNAIGEGETPPPELDVISTPRSGIAITHRIAVAFAGELPSDSSIGDPWETTPRAQAEPFLNAWAAKLFGGSKANKAICKVEFHGQDPNDKNKKILLDTKEIGFKQLKLAPIDLLYFSAQAGEMQRSELEQRIIYEAQRLVSTEVLEKSTEIKLSFSNASIQSADEVSFAELLEVARTTLKLITASRPLNAGDFAQPDEKKQEPDNIELSERIEKTIEQFKSTSDELRTVLSGSNPSSEKIHEMLISLADYGITGAVPLNLVGKTPEILAALRTQAESVLRDAEERIKRIDSIIKDQMNQQDYHFSRLREVFGPEFRIMPRFIPKNSKDLNATFAESGNLQGENPLESVTWFQRVSRVREGAARLDKTMIYAEALGGTALGFTVGQLPYFYDEEKKNKRWAALPLESDELSGSRVSLVVHEPLSVDPNKLSDFNQLIAGLLIDEWVEVVPNKEEMTGLAFHYDTPQSRAPQAILLAVAPETVPDWDLATLEATVVETLELAKLRAVDLTALEEVGQFLPALYFPQTRVPE